MTTQLRPLTVLHTSDWHIGRALYGRKRYEEFDAFLSWMVATLQRHAVDVLLVAGDVFDTTTPSNRAQELYYRFLCRVAATSCRHIIIIAGNHDSPTFLNAPKELLKAINVHVVGHASENPEEEVLPLFHDGRLELIVCAVPFLRDRDVRMLDAGESIEDKERKLLEGVQRHYGEVAGLAEKKRLEFGEEIPIVAMGHLFTAGGKTIEDDGVRSLYIGSLVCVSGGIFPANLDYVALGHLHIPQRVNNSEVMRYSGSPLPMGFGEARQQKSVCLVEFTSSQVVVKLINVPVFQQLERVSGTWQEIATRIQELLTRQENIWLEVVYTGDEVMSDLRERLDAAVIGSGVEILRVKNNRIFDRILARVDGAETLDDLNEHDVFARFLDLHNVPEDQRLKLLGAYQEAVALVYQNDIQAE